MDDPINDSVTGSDYLVCGLVEASPKKWQHSIEASGHRAIGRFDISPWGVVGVVKAIVRYGSVVSLVSFAEK
jgi:hypothetical protein